MNGAIVLIEDNLKLPIEYQLIMIATLSAFIFMAGDFKLGAIMGMLLNAGLFAWFYQWNQVNSTILFVPPLLASLSFVVILALTLYASSRTAPIGGVT